MEIEVARPEVAAAIGGNRDFVAEHTAMVIEDFDRSGLFSVRGSAFVAARDEDRQPVVWRHPCLVRVDAGIERFNLGHFLPWRAILVDPVDAQGAWLVEGDQNVFRRDVGGHVDGARRKSDGCSVQRRRAARRRDLQCDKMVRISWRSTIARGRCGVGAEPGTSQDENNLVQAIRSDDAVRRYARRLRHQL